MSIEEGQIQTETLQEPPKPESQPNAPTGQPAAEPVLDDAAVREAIARAEAQGQNPESLTVSDLSQGQPQEPPKAEAPTLDVPEKFLKTDGKVDVEKLQASTRQLREAVQAKEQALNQVGKTVQDYVAEYRALEKQLSSTPNPERLAASLQVPPPPPTSPQTMNDQQLRDLLMQDYKADPIATTAQLIEIAIQKRLEPYENERKDNAIRGNIEQLASKDPRVLQPDYFAAINAKLNAWKTEDPARLHQKNPHKAAWLEVKEELRLGDPSERPVQAQPSKTPSPVLGGGTPPSVPSSSSPQGVRAVDQLRQLDPRDKKQEAMGDEFIRSLLERKR